MNEVKISLRAASNKQSPIFQPEVMAAAKIVEVVVMEKETEGGRTAVAFCLELLEPVLLTTGARVMTKTTAKIVDGIAAATRQGCIQWGDHENWREYISQMREVAIAYNKWLRKNKHNSKSDIEKFNQFFEEEIMK